MPAKTKFDCLLTYGWVRSTYAALVNLGQKGLNVAIGDCTRIGMSQFSRYSKKVFKYTSFLADKSRFLNNICDILDTAKPTLYLPSHDETELISEHLHIFPSQTLIPIPSIKLLQIANNKSESQEFADKIGLPTATRINYELPEQLLDLIDASRKMVIRTLKGNSAKGVYYASGPEHVYQTVKSVIENYQCTKERYPVVQEYVCGEGWGVSCLYWEGKRIAHFTHRRLREKTATGGTSTLREHQPNPLLENMAFQLLDKLEWHGLAMVEFKYDPIENKGYFIEINPRLWGSIHLAISAGVEFPYLIYLCATKGPESALSYFSKCKIRFPWRSRWYLGDCIIAANKILHLKFQDFATCLLPGNTDTYDDLCLSDPLPFLGEILYYGTNFIRHRSTNPIQDGMIG